MKAQYQERTKRIFNPPYEFDPFVDVLRQRFKDLDAKMQSGSTQIHLNYLDNEGDKIEVEDSNDLSEGLMFA